MVYIIKDSLPRLSNECDGLLGHLSHEGTDWVAFLLHLGTPQGEHGSSLPLVEFQGFIAECRFAEPTQSLRDMHILAPVQVTTQCMQFPPPPNKTLVQYVAASRDEDRFLLPRRWGFYGHGVLRRDRGAQWIVRTAMIEHQLCPAERRGA